jgi:hypothetical protein
MRNSGFGIFVFLGLLGALSGCVGATAVHKAEVIALQPIDPRSYSDNVAYARKLASDYIDLSDRASAAQDATAMALIGTAGVAAGALLFDGSLDLVKSAGLAAGGLSATASYFRPGESSEYLLDAAEQLICISKVAVPPPTDDPVEGLAVLKTGITTVRLNLRKKLQRTLPDYGKLLQTLKETAGEHIENEERTVDQLEADIAKCLL